MKAEHLRDAIKEAAIHFDSTPRHKPIVAVLWRILDRAEQYAAQEQEQPKIATTIELPSWVSCETKADAGEASRLEAFIWSHEPSDERDAQMWRDQLAAVLAENKQQ